MKKTILLILLSIMYSSVSQAQIKIYPVAVDSMRSKLYTVEIFQGNKKYNGEVYTDNARWQTNNSKTTSWCSFAMDSLISVRITSLQNKIKLCNVLPRRHAIVTKIIDERTVEFEISQVGQYSVEFQEGIFIDHPLFIFADKPAPEIVPDAKTLVFEKGVHNIGDKYELKSGQTVYLAAGAYVKGQFFASNARDITIIGQGILSGEDYPARSHNHMISMNNCENVVIEGITIINAPRFCVSIRGNNQICRNLKMMGWWFSTDGIGIGNNGLIEDCFFKVNDDAIKLYHSNTVARRCVIWQMENGAPFQIGWNMGGFNSNFHVYDIDIIRVEHQWDNPNEAVFNAIHGSEGIMNQYLFENIRIDNCDFRLFYIVTQPNRFGKWNPERGKVCNLIFRNIECYTFPRMRNLIKGFDKLHPVENVVIDNLRVGGKKISNAKEASLISDPNTTYNIVFK